jgi:phospholipid-binding lipoprotein MlaA
MRRATDRTARLVIAIAAIAVFGPLSVERAVASEVYDPLEKMNRGVFWFNDKLDTYLLRPIAKGYDRVLPSPVKSSIRNAIDNLYSPVYTANNLLQAKPKAAGTSVGRFVVNTTVGIAGLFDPASTIGLDSRREDFGQTLGVWGTGSGPYLVIPLIGPTNVRDGVGRLVDSPLRIWPFFVDFEWNMAEFGVEVVSTRAQHLGTIDTLRETSFDFYAAVRNGYDQRRSAAIRDSTEKNAETEEDLYFLEDGEE